MDLSCKFFQTVRKFDWIDLPVMVVEPAVVQHEGAESQCDGLFGQLAGQLGIDVLQERQPGAVHHAFTVFHGGQFCPDQ